MIEYEVLRSKLSLVKSTNYLAIARRDFLCLIRDLLRSLLSDLKAILEGGDVAKLYPILSPYMLDKDMLFPQRKEVLDLRSADMTVLTDGLMGDVIRRLFDQDSEEQFLIAIRNLISEAVADLAPIASRSTREVSENAGIVLEKHRQKIAQVMQRFENWFLEEEC